MSYFGSCPECGELIHSDNIGNHTCIVLPYWECGTGGLTPGYACAGCGKWVTGAHECVYGYGQLDGPYNPIPIVPDKPNEKVIEKIDELQLSLREIAESMVFLEMALKDFVSAYIEEMVDAHDREIMDESD